MIKFPFKSFHIKLRQQKLKYIFFEHDQKDGNIGVAR